MSQVPTDPVIVPEPVSRAAGGRPITPVWVNGLGGTTFQLGTGPARSFAKWAPAGSSIDLRAEADRCRWAAAYTSVPRVLDFGETSDGTWLVTEGLPGGNAISPRWKAEPRRASVATGQGLRRLHDALPADECPFDWSVRTRLAQAASEGVPPTAALAAPPAIERTVVCHGDACIPNTLLDDSGHCTGHVDLGALGVADRWADLAIATMSLEWNYGPGWQNTFLEAYGVEPDQERTDFYRDLWNLGDDSVTSKGPPTR